MVNKGKAIEKSSRDDNEDEQLKEGGLENNEVITIHQ